MYADPLVLGQKNANWLSWQLAFHLLHVLDNRKDFVPNKKIKGATFNIKKHTSNNQNSSHHRLAEL